MKRVALCFAGSPEYWSYTFENISNNLIKNNPGYIFDTFLCIYNNKNFPIDKIISTYQPKSFKIKNDGTQLDKLYEVFKMKTSYETENNFVYDLVVRMRFEIVFNTKVNLSEINIYDDYIYCIDHCKNTLPVNLLYDIVYAYNSNSITNKQLYAQILDNYKTKLNTNYGVMDWFFFGTSKSMNFILLLYETLSSSIVYSKHNISHEMYIHIGILLAKYQLYPLNFMSFQPYLVHLTHRKEYANVIPLNIQNDIKNLNSIE
jgi:hypothetical protein